MGEGGKNDDLNNYDENESVSKEERNKTKLKIAAISFKNT